MQLIKLMDDTDTLVVVTDETIQLGDYYINTDSSNRYAYKKIFRAMPTQLKGEPDYFKKWMRKIIGSTKPLKAKGFERYHTTNLTVEEILLLLKNQKLNIMYSLDCSFFDREFHTIGELIDHIINFGCDPNYEITKDGIGTGEQAIDLIQF